MKRLILSAGILACTLGTYAQSTETKAEPKGKAIIQIFTNFHSGFGSDNDDRGFELDRSYLGYQYDLGKGLSAKAIMDVGQSSDINDFHRVAYIKNAMVTWKTGDWTFNGGVIPTNQFALAQKHWGYRYAYRSFQDIYKFGSSADLGVSAEWKASDKVSLDAIVVNGEGYKKIQKSDGLLYGLGATFTPVQGLTLRLYASLNEQQEEGMKDVMNYSAFVGYKGKGFSVGAEYNMMENTKGMKDMDQNGISAYGTVNICKNAEVFARFDEICSKDDWNRANDESAVVVGAQWKIGKYIKVAPNFRMSMPKASGADERYAGYISCSFVL